MKNKKHWVNFILFVVPAAGLAVGARPAIGFLEGFLSDGEPKRVTIAAAVLLYGMAAIVVLTAISGFLAVARGPVAGTSVLLVLIAALCGAGLYFGVQNMPVGEAEPTGTPRPTVTPPEVTIDNTIKSNGNPETGTVFYSRYGEGPSTLIVENNSQSDICFRMSDRHDLLVMVFYVRAGETGEFKAPLGTYEFRCVTGKIWENEKTYFGERSYFRKLAEQVVIYHGSTAKITLSPGLPEMKIIKQQEYEAI